MSRTSDVVPNSVQPAAENASAGSLSLIQYGRHFRSAAVLGAGVMGAQIAAHLANAGVHVWLFELATDGRDKNANAKRAVQGLSMLKPSPLATQGVSHLIHPANYDEHLEALKNCDLVLEAITERLDWKHDLLIKIIPYLKDDAVLATNTSGIDIHKIAQVLPDHIRQRFCGIHFFNPPRYMPLLEVIPHRETRQDILDLLEGFFTTNLGKGVVFAKDTPGFIGNRVGIFALLAVMHHAERLGLAFDLVDKLTGSGIGRPKSATFRTADVVGLDTFAHVVDNLGETLPEDPWHKYYRVPDWTQTLIKKGALGQKTRGGVYKKEGKEIHVLDASTMDYRRVRPALDDEVRTILLNKDPAAKYQALLACDHPQADFLLSIFLDLFHFSAYHLTDIAHTARDIDFALRWGYGWNMGPFEVWQTAGWQRVAEDISQRIGQGAMMADVPLPEWATTLDRNGVHDSKGSWSVVDDRVVPRSTHPVYYRQVFPEVLVGETRPLTHTVFEDDAVRLWHGDDEIAVLGFKTKMHTVTEDVLKGILQAVEVAENDFKGLVLWQTESPFCAGANLFDVITAVKQGRYDQVEGIVSLFQQASMALKHANVPTVAAVQGLALGGGCEFIMHCDRVVSALESYIGLVEVGVGIVPAGGGSKELVRRAADEAKGTELFPFIAQYFERVAMAKVTTSAEQAREWGYLRPADKVVFNPHELLHVAKHEVLALYEAGYRPPLRRQDIPAAGASGIATLQAQLFNMVKGGFISEHDYEIGQRLACIFCGGEVESGSRVSDEWLLRLEIEAFMALLKMDKTQERIQHMLKTGKPLRN